MGGNAFFDEWGQEYDAQGRRRQQGGTLKKDPITGVGGKVISRLLDALGVEHGYDASVGIGDAVANSATGIANIAAHYAPFEFTNTPSGNAFAATAPTRAGMMKTQGYPNLGMTLKVPQAAQDWQAANDRVRAGQPSNMDGLLLSAPAFAVGGVGAKLEGTAARAAMPERVRAVEPVFEEIQPGHYYNNPASDASYQRDAGRHILAQEDFNNAGGYGSVPADRSFDRRVPESHVGDSASGMAATGAIDRLTGPNGINLDYGDMLAKLDRRSSTLHANADERAALPGVFVQDSDNAFASGRGGTGPRTSNDQTPFYGAHVGPKGQLIDDPAALADRYGLETGLPGAPSDAGRFNPSTASLLQRGVAPKQTAAYYRKQMQGRGGVPPGAMLDNAFADLGVSRPDQVLSRDDLVRAIEGRSPRIAVEKTLTKAEQEALVDERAAAIAEMSDHMRSAAENGTAIDASPMQARLQAADQKRLASPENRWDSYATSQAPDAMARQPGVVSSRPNYQETVIGYKPAKPRYDLSNLTAEDREILGASASSEGYEYARKLTDDAMRDPRASQFMQVQHANLNDIATRLIDNGPDVGTPGSFKDNHFMAHRDAPNGSPRDNLEGWQRGQMIDAVRDMSPDESNAFNVQSAAHDAARVGHFQAQQAGVDYRMSISRAGSQSRSDYVAAQRDRLTSPEFEALPPREQANLRAEVRDNIEMYTGHSADQTAELRRLADTEAGAHKILRDTPSPTKPTANYFLVDEAQDQRSRMYEKNKGAEPAEAQRLRDGADAARRDYFENKGRAAADLVRSPDIQRIIASLDPKNSREQLRAALSKVDYSKSMNFDKQAVADILSSRNPNDSQLGSLVDMLEGLPHVADTAVLAEIQAARAAHMTSTQLSKTVGTLDDRNHYVLKKGDAADAMHILQTIRDNANDLLPVPPGGGLDHPNMQMRDNILGTYNGANNALNAMTDAIARADAAEHGVKPSPYTSRKADATHLLANEAVRDAAAGDARGIAWVPGDENAVRMGIGTHVKGLSYSPRDGRLGYVTSDGSQNYFPKVDPGKLDEMLGADLAQELRKQPTIRQGEYDVHRLDVPEGKVIGGRGMNAFYGNEHGLDRDGRQALYPGQLAKIIGRMDPEADVTARPLDMDGFTTKVNKSFPHIKLTEEAKRKARQIGLRLFSNGSVVPAAAGAAAQAQDNAFAGGQ